MRLLLTTAFLFILQMVCGQQVNLMVTDVREQRALDQDNSTVELTLKVNGIKVDENRMVKFGRITKATDNLGNALEEKESSFGYDYKDRNEVSFKVSAPPRKATALSTVEGTIKYFSPTLENKGKVEINKPLDKYNTNFLKGVVSDVKLILIDEEGLKKKKAENDAAFDKELEKFRKENAINEKVGGFMTGLKDFFESMFSFGSSGPSMGFYLDDPKKKIVSISVYDEKNEKVNNGYFSSGTQMTVNLNTAPKNTWKVVVMLENEKSMKEINFSLNNVFLP
ncbi:MAG TPA: hypothetical protein DDY18_08655 [Flavobacterium sp.]|nr:hypothetical protein [Flavobacterium sp.]